MQFLGFGLGLRTPHYDYVLEHQPPVDWFEIISEDYLGLAGRSRYYLDAIKEHYPLVMHGVSMSLGSADPLDKHYLKQLKALADHVNPPWFSDHLCWTGVHGKNMHDLLPLPYTDEAIRQVSEKVRQAQDYLQRPMLLENVSSYITYEDSAMTEWDFYRAVCEEADCLMLLDVNNIYVSAFNHDFDAMDYLLAIDKKRVQQFHIAGHDNCGNHIVDTHDHPVIDPVWDLYQAACQRFGPVSTMIERDANIPEFPELFAELQQAKKIATPFWEEVIA